VIRILDHLYEPGLPRQLWRQRSWNNKPYHYGLDHPELEFQSKPGWMIDGNADHRFYDRCDNHLRPDRRDERKLVPVRSVTRRTRTLLAA